MSKKTIGATRSLSATSDSSHGLCRLAATTSPGAAVLGVASPLPRITAPFRTNKEVEDDVFNYNSASPRLDVLTPYCRNNCKMDGHRPAQRGQHEAEKSIPQ